MTLRKMDDKKYVHTKKNVVNINNCKIISNHRKDVIETYIYMENVIER